MSNFLAAVSVASLLAAPPSFADDALRPPGMAPVVVAEPGLDTAEETPPLSGGRIVGEVLLGSLLGVGGTVAGAYAGYQIETRGDCSSEWCGVGGLVLGGLAGLTFATPVGVYLAGASGGQTASFGWTVGGSAIGAALGLGLTGASEGGMWPALVAGPLVGSIVGFNATRRYDRSERRQARIVPVASAAPGAATLGLAGTF